MAGVRKSTCKSCLKQLLPDEKCTYKNKIYCQTCVETLINEAKLKKDKEKLEKKLTKKQVPKTEDNGYQQLIDAICTYFKINAPTPLILQQLKQFKNEFNYLYTGIHYCLYYVTSIENKVLDVKYGVALLKFYYDKSKQYFEQQQRITASVQNIEYIEPKVNVVKINLNRVYEKKNNFLIDINQFCEGE